MGKLVGTKPVFDPDCEFCRIIRHETEAHVVWEDGDSIAFFPLSPAVAGHTLVVPKQHITDYWAADPVIVQHLALAVHLVGHGILAALRPDGMNLISSAGEAASQTVYHLHMHVVPRWTQDRLGRIWPPERELSPELEDDLAMRIRDGIDQSVVRRGHDYKDYPDDQDRNIEPCDRMRPK
jgi:histidine triad (HIT) family protein